MHAAGTRERSKMGRPQQQALPRGPDGDRGGGRHIPSTLSSPEPLDSFRSSCNRRVSPSSRAMRCSGEMGTRELERAQPHSRNASGMLPQSSARARACVCGTLGAIVCSNPCASACVSSCIGIVRGCSSATPMLLRQVRSSLTFGARLSMLETNSPKSDACSRPVR